jgi:hypothetical protein
MTTIALDDETIATTPDEPWFIVGTIQDADGAGTLYPYGLATSTRVVDGRLTLLAGDEPLDVYEAGAWWFYGQVHLAPGESEPQPDGRLIRAI